jgi:AraC family transcriptional regulator
MRGHAETVRSRGPIDVIALSLPHVLFRRMSGLEDIRIEPSSGSLDPRLRHLMLLIEAERNLGFPTGNLFLDAACDAVTALLLSSRTGRSPSKASLDRSRIQLVRDAIVDHLDEPMSLADLAGLVGVSTTTLSREFRRCLGVTVHHYALGLRIERCKIMLRLPEGTITDVALATGFQTPQHMATVFKRFTGKTPSEFRASLP